MMMAQTSTATQTGTMAPAGTGQREPSMEEILASIRRIIEDSDTVRQPLEGDSPPQLLQTELAMQADEAHGDKTTHGDETRQEVEAFRAGLDEGVIPRQAAFDPAPETVAAVPLETVASWPQVEILPFSGVAGERAETPDVPVSEGESQPMAIAAGGAASSQAVSGSAGAPADTKSSLISDHTGRQVAAAFGELSEAFAASRRRSFDEMAEEMLRPMLQDWLDNNLPTLVERLVREEIERVARGG